MAEERSASIDDATLTVEAGPDGRTPIKLRFASPGRAAAGVCRNPRDLRVMAAVLLQAADAAESGDEATIKTVVLRCDALDACAIDAAINCRKAYSIPILPDFDGDEDAATLAEACRAYLDEYDKGDAYGDAIKAAGLDVDAES